MKVGDVAEIHINDHPGQVIRGKVNLDEQTLLLRSQLDYRQANDEIIYAMGRTPE